MKRRWLHRLRQRRREVAGLVIVMLLMIISMSWSVSFRTPHGTYVTGQRRYGVWCDSGSIQFRYGVKTELDFENPGRWTIREIGYDDASSRHWGRQSLKVVLRQWPPFQQAEFASGGEAPTINGTSEFFGERVHIWGVPHWFPACLLMLPLMWIVYSYFRTRAERRIAQGLCGNCGYDMRASPDRCPECGTVKSAVTASTIPAT
jgi:hypothetical protein